MNKSIIAVSLLLALSLAACTSLIPGSDKAHCEELMDQAWQELTQAKLTSVSGAWQLTKASKFLAQAKVKYETERFELCIEKAETARELLIQLDD